MRFPFVVVLLAALGFNTAQAEIYKCTVKVGRSLPRPLVAPMIFRSSPMPGSRARKTSPSRNRPTALS